MATATTHSPLPPLLLLLLLLLLLIVTTTTTTTTAAASGSSSSEAGELWCVAKNNAEDAALQAALDWACGPGGADCRPIQPGGACYDPDDIQSHASFAFNDYFLRSPRPDASASACDFSGTAALTSLNPGHGSCLFPSSSSARNGNFTGRSDGMGPSGADLSGGLQIKISPWPSSIALFVLLVATNIREILVCGRDFVDCVKLSWGNQTHTRMNQMRPHPTLLWLMLFSVISCWTSRTYT